MEMDDGPCHQPIGRQIHDVAWTEYYEKQIGRADRLAWVNAVKGGAGGMGRSVLESA